MNKPSASRPWPRPASLAGVEPFPQIWGSAIALSRVSTASAETIQHAEPKPSIIEQSPCLRCELRGLTLEQVEAAAESLARPLPGARETVRRRMRRQIQASAAVLQVNEPWLRVGQGPMEGDEPPPSEDAITSAAILIWKPERCTARARRRVILGYAEELFSAEDQSHAVEVARLLAAALAAPPRS